MACLKKPLSIPSEFPRTLQHPLLSRPRTHILTVPFFLLSLFLLSASYNTRNSPTVSRFPFSWNYEWLLAARPEVTLSNSCMVNSEPEPQSRGTLSSVTAAERTHRSSNSNSTNYRESQLMRDLTSCDIFDGAWVHDDDAEPIYQHGSCPFLDDAFNCFKNGRSDF